MRYPYILPYILVIIALATLMVHSVPTQRSPSSDPNRQLWNPSSHIIPEPQRGESGASILGPHNIPLELQNADSLAPPTTDHGEVKNYKWPFSLSHTKLNNGGWSRDQNGNVKLAMLCAPAKKYYSVDSLPVATQIAGNQAVLSFYTLR